MTPVNHPVWLTLLVATLFTMLIVLPAVVVSIIYPLVLLAGSWTTAIRRKYPLPDYRHPTSVDTPK